MTPSYHLACDDTMLTGLSGVRRVADGAVNWTRTSTSSKHARKNSTADFSQTTIAANGANWSARKR